MATAKTLLPQKWRMWRQGTFWLDNAVLRAKNSPITNYILSSSLADNETPVFVIGPMARPDDEISVLDIQTPN